MKVRSLFVNLPVKDLRASVDYFTKLGFGFDSRYTDQNAACLIIGDNMYAMLLAEPFFTSFTKKQITDSRRSSEVILALAVDSRSKVDNLVDRALELGGKKSNEPVEQPWMYGRSFQDLEGHIWEVFFMDQSKFEE